MISRVFGKTKPINYILAIGFFLLCLVFVKFRLHQNEEILVSEGIQVSVILGLLFSLLIGNFIAVSSQLISPNVLTLYFFSVLFLIFPEVILNYRAIFANGFILVTILRLNQIKQFHNIQSNLLDASLAVLIASLFLQWALLYLLMVFIYLYVYSPRNLRNWFIPLAATLLFGLLTLAAAMISKNGTYIYEQYQFSVNNAGTLFTGQSLKHLLFLGAITALAFYGFRKSNKYGYGKALLMRLSSLTLLIGIAAIILQPSNEGSAIFLAFFPASVYINQFVDSQRKRWIKEFFLTAIFITGLVVFTTEWIR